MPNSTIIADFSAFIKNSNQEQPTAQNPFLLTFKLFLVNILIVISIGLLLVVVFMLIDAIFGVGLKEFAKGNILRNLTNSQYFWKGVILAPILEELCFRWFLKANKTNISIASGLLLGLFVSKFFWPDIPLQYKLSIATTISGIVYMLIQYSDKEKTLIDFFEKNRARSYYISSIVFGLVHIGNQQEITAIKILLSPLITMPQIIMGFFLGYVRVKYGLVYSISVHSLNNLLAFAMRSI